MGVRLRSLHPELPKGLLEIGGRPLIAHSLGNLGAHGIHDVTLVTGYRADAYAAYLANHFPQVRLVHNADFARTGSMHSLFLAQGRVAGDILLLESDLLYEPRAVSALLAAGPGNHVLVSGPTGQGDEVYAGAGDGRLTFLTKTPAAGASPVGEFTGLSRLTAGFVAAMCRHYQQRVSFPSNYHYDDCLSDFCREHPIQVLKVADLLWGEIDDPAHHARAVTQLWPALMHANTHVHSP